MRRDHIERLLPASFQRTTGGRGVLDALLMVMDSLHAPSESVLSHVDDLVAAYRAPDVLVPFLVTWVAFDHLDLTANDGAPAAGGKPDAARGTTDAARGTTDAAGGTTDGRLVPVGRLRELVGTAASLAAARGTASGLCRLLDTVTGVDGFRVDEPAERAFHLVVRVPPAAGADLDLIRRVVAAEKPAATTFEVVQDGPTSDQPPTGAE
jgi:hypothetical protein